MGENRVREYIDLCVCVRARVRACVRACVRVSTNVLLPDNHPTKVLYVNPTEGDRFLRTIKINSTPSFGGEVKLSTLCRKILWNVKYLKYPFEL
jgi:hypothetical protein